MESVRTLYFTCLDYEKTFYLSVDSEEPKDSGDSKEALVWFSDNEGKKYQFK